MRAPRIERLREGLPRLTWEQLRRVFVFGVGLSDAISARRDPLLPPAPLRVRIGAARAESFVAFGPAHLEMFRASGGLHPEDRILDVGSGCGRLARSLTSYLDGCGSYDGVDVDRESIAWSRQAFRAFPRFRFQVLDVFNALYNPGGQLKGSELSFPFEKDHFDLAILMSVLNHLIPEDVPNYLREISRVLTPGGMAWITLFLWNEKAARRERQSPGNFPFPYRLGSHRVMNLEQPEVGVCLAEDWMQAECARAGLSIQEVRLGYWRGLDHGTDLQDLIIARKS